MAAIKLKARIGKFVPDRRLAKAVEKGQRKWLFSTGNLLRKTAANSIREAGKKGGKAHVSKPGKPPKWHVRPGIKAIVFDVDERSGTVAIGPARKTGGVAEMLEKGGVITVRRKRHKNGRLVIEKSRVRIKPRPVMQLALDKHADKLAAELKDLTK